MDIVTLNSLLLEWTERGYIFLVTDSMRNFLESYFGKEVIIPKLLFIKDPLISFSEYQPEEGGNFYELKINLNRELKTIDICAIKQI